MKKVMILFAALILAACFLPGNAEDVQSAAVTIGYFPSNLCGRYGEYIPDEDTQRQLLDMLHSADFIDWSHDDRAFPDYAEVSLGVTLSYEGFTAHLRTGGWVRRLEDDGLGIWFAQDGNIAEFVTGLLAGRGYDPFEPAGIKHIVRAELWDGEYYSGEAHEPIVISDPTRLATLEKIVARSTQSEPSGCPFGYAKLVLIDDDGSQYELYPATDSCAQYFVNGSFFNYDTSTGDEKHDTNQVLFDLFGIFPTDYFHNVR